MELLNCNISDTQKLIVGDAMNKYPLVLQKRLGVSTYIIPLYRSFLKDEGRRISSYSSAGSPIVEHADVIKEGGLFLGDCVGTDQFECRIKGRLPNFPG